MSTSHFLEIFMRTLIAFLWLLVMAHLIGRQIFAHSTYHLFVISSLLGTIAGNLAFNINIHLYYFLFSFFMMSVISYLFMWIALKSSTARKWISGEAIMVVKDGKVLDQNMKKCNYTLDLLEQGLRSKNIFNLNEVELAILEVNGSLSVLKKPGFRNVTKKDLKGTKSTL